MSAGSSTSYGAGRVYTELCGAWSIHHVLGSSSQCSSYSNHRIATAFAEIPQKVLWRYQGEQPSTLENITLILEWFPQNDLLGHPTTCVFVSHGGTNGIYSMKLFTMESPSQLCHSSLTCLTMFCDCRFEVRLECFKSQCSPRKSSSKPSKMSKLSELNCDRPCLLSIAPLFGLSTLLDTKEQLTFTQRGIICLGTLTTT